MSENHKTLFYCLGQRDEIAGLAAQIRSKLNDNYPDGEILERDLALAVANYLEPYQNWDTFQYYKDRFLRLAALTENDQYNLGVLFVVNSIKSGVLKINNYVELVYFYLNQYDIHYEVKSKETSDKNPHVQFLRGILRPFLKK